jgi:hypothetical protein
VTPRVGLLFIALAAGAPSCGAQLSGPGPVDPPASLARLRPEPYAFTLYSGLTDRERLVIRDEAAWAAVWQRIHQGTAAPPPLPSADFTREMLVVVALGQRSSGGHSILLESAEVAGDAMVVRVRTIAPGTGCGTTMALTQPVDIGRVRRREGTVRFDERTETRACP